jgi:hypothetical protein
LKRDEIFAPRWTVDLEDAGDGAVGVAVDGERMADLLVGEGGDANGSGELGVAAEGAS